MLRVVASEGARQEFALADEICRLGAERMLAAALEAEVEAYVERDRDARDDQGRALVVRNGHARPRNVVAGAGALGARAPRVDDGRIDPATGKRHRFRSSILPPYIRRSPKVAEVLPLLYLHGLSTKDFVPALAEFFGSEAGLSAPAITRLTGSWAAEQEAFMSRDLSEVDYVYCWVDGVHFSVRLGDDDRLCVLVMVGVRIDGTKELVAIADGYRESTESWAELLRDAKRRGMRAPVLAVGDGALGFWAAVRDVFGVKTGSDDAAGGCFAFRAIRWIDGKRTTITGVVLGQAGHDQIAAALAAADAMVDRNTGQRAAPDPQQEPCQRHLRPQASDQGCPPLYVDPKQDPRMQQ